MRHRQIPRSRIAAPRAIVRAAVTPSGVEGLATRDPVAFDLCWE
jgi:hypothetical protein